MNPVRVENELVARLAQSMGRQPFEVVLAFGTTKRRRALLRAEAVRQDELSRLVRERLLARGQLWTPAPGSRLAREWGEVKRQLVHEGAIDGQ